MGLMSRNLLIILLLIGLVQVSCDEWSAWSEFSDCDCKSQMQSRGRVCPKSQECEGVDYEEVPCPASCKLTPVESAIDNPNGYHKCTGGIKILYSDQTSIFTNIPLPSFTKPVNNLFVSGNCCWKIFSRQNFRGEGTHLPLGEQWNQDFEPMSIAKVKC